MLFKWLDFKITKRCNNQCTYCGVEHDKPNAKEILSIKDIHSTISDALSLGFSHFAFLGGEPSIRENVDQIFIPFENSKDVTVLVITNGLIFNKKMYESLYTCGAQTAKIVYSFDSFNKPNYKNQDPEKALKNIHKIKEIAEKYSSGDKIRDIEIHCVISRENYKKFGELVEYFENINIDVSLALVCPSTFVNSATSNKYNVFTYEELGEMIKQLEILKSKGLLNFANTVLLEYLQKYPYNKIHLKTSCNAGRNHVIINFDGEVYPCITESYRRGIRFGNIGKTRFKTIYKLMKNFKCKSDFAPACWDHFLWNKLEEHLSR